ncbi:MAG: hypothetical protein N2645_14820 [Clostridia bacterium]|nr:hypothetical protein [Clostridia bacterium]
MLINFTDFFKPDEVFNFEWSEVFEINFKETVTEMFCLGLINGNYFGEQEEIVRATRSIMERALKECPKWTTQCAIYGQENNNIKIIPILWLVYLSTLPEKTLFEKAFPRIIVSPARLYNFLMLTRKAGIRQGMGRSVKRVVNFWLNEKLNDDDAVRYKAKLKEIVKTTRPIAVEKIQPYIAYVLKGDDEAFARASAIKKVYKGLKEGNVNASIFGLIKEYGLKFNDLKHIFSGLTRIQRKTIFEFLIYGLKYNELAENLTVIENAFDDALITQDVMTSKSILGQSEAVSFKIPMELVNEISRKLRDYEAFRRSKMLPFELIAVKEKIRVVSWKNSLDEVLQKSGREVFNVPGNIGIRVGVDTSHSMSSNVTSSLTQLDIASLFSSMVHMSIRKAEVYATGSISKKVEIKKYNGLYENAQMIKDTKVGCGNRFETLLDGYQGEKYVLLITGGKKCDELKSRWIRLKGRPRGSKLMIWHIKGYEHYLTRRNDIVCLNGYNDRVLYVLKNIIEDIADRGLQIESIQI